MALKTDKLFQWSTSTALHDVLWTKKDNTEVIGSIREELSSRKKKQN